MRRDQQALDDLAILQVRLHDFINVVVIDIAVPDRIGIHHTHGACSAAVETARLIDPYLADSAQPRRLDGLFAVRCPISAIVIGAAGLAGLALIGAKKDVALKIRRASERSSGARGDGIGHGADFTAWRRIDAGSLREIPKSDILEGFPASA